MANLPSIEIPVTANVTGSALRIAAYDRANAVTGPTMGDRADDRLDRVLRRAARIEAYLTTGSTSAEPDADG